MLRVENTAWSWALFTHVSTPPPLPGCVGKEFPINSISEASLKEKQKPPKHANIEPWEFAQLNSFFP